MAIISDFYLDKTIEAIRTDCNQLVLCTQEPTTYTQAFTTYKVATKTSPTITAPADGSPNGRRITVSQFTDGTVSGNGTATHFALIDTVNSRLAVVNTLTTSQAVTSGNTFSITSDITIRIPDAV